MLSSTGSKEIDGEERLYLAAASNDSETIKLLIENNDLNINHNFNSSFIQKQHYGNGILHIMSENGAKSDVLNDVLKLGARLDLRNNLGELPIHIACKIGNEEALKLFISQKSDTINAKDNRGRMPLHSALSNYKLCYDGGADTHHLVIKTLLENGADVNATVDGLSSLHFSCTSYAIKSVVVQTLLNAGADVKVVTPDGRTPLHLAIYEFARRKSQLLIDKGADTNALEKSGKSPLLLAIEKDEMEIVHQLVANGADVNYVWKKLGLSIMEFALNKKHLNAIAFLFNNGAKLPQNEPLIAQLLMFAMLHDYVLMKNLIVFYFPLHDETKNQGIKQAAVKLRNKRNFNILCLAGAKFNSEDLKMLKQNDDHIVISSYIDDRLSVVPRLKHLSCLKLRKMLGPGIQDKLSLLVATGCVPRILVDCITLRIAMDKESDVY